MYPSYLNPTETTVHEKIAFQHTKELFVGFENKIQEKVLVFGQINQSWPKRWRPWMLWRPFITLPFGQGKWGWDVFGISGEPTNSFFLAPSGALLEPSRPTADPAPAPTVESASLKVRKRLKIGNNWINSDKKLDKIGKLEKLHLI